MSDAAPADPHAECERRFAAIEMRLNHVEADRAKLTRRNRKLIQYVVVLKEEVRELTARLNSDSTKSSKPPSSDKPWKEWRKQKPTGRSPGAQPGHKGKTREPFPPEKVDHEVTVLPKSCSKCGRVLGAKDTADESLAHQVVEIPPVVAEAFECVLQECRCPGCGHTTTRGTVFSPYESTRMWRTWMLTSITTEPGGALGFDLFRSRGLSRRDPLGTYCACGAGCCVAPPRVYARSQLDQEATRGSRVPMQPQLRSQVGE